MHIVSKYIADTIPLYVITFRIPPTPKTQQYTKNQTSPLTEEKKEDESVMVPYNKFDPIRPN